MTMRVLTYNVRSLRDDPQAVARVIRSVAPDVVCIQEAPRFLRWRSKCAELARRSGLVVVGGGRSAAANLLLSSLRVDVLETKNILLSPEPGLHRRGIAWARLRLAGEEFIVAGAHLDLREEARLRHVAEVERVLAQLAPAEVPSIVCADVNDDPGSPTWNALSRSRIDAYAHLKSGPDSDGEAMASNTPDDPEGATSGPADHPRRRIDAIFVSPSIQVRRAQVLRGRDVERASDHRPVLAELDLSSL